jgi:biotin carboxyl carrier protein
MEYIAITEQGEFPIEILKEKGEIAIGGQVHQVDMQDIGNRDLYSLLVDNHSCEVLIEQEGERFRVLVGGKLYNVRVVSKDRYLLSKLVSPPPMPKGEAAIRAPMPGLVVSVPVAAGQAVSAGQVLVVLESMKMENEVRAPQDGVVQAVHVAAGELVNNNQVLLVLH